MQKNSDDFLSYKRTIDMIGMLVENWFDANEVPEQYRMSIPLILLFEKKQVSGATNISFFVSYLSNQKEAIGNC